MASNPHAKFRCDDCDAVFPLRRARITRHGDEACPECGSVRVQREVTRFQKLYAFLITYETY
ncbi:MAG: hypothetical protein Kow0047_09120 [Anaerolineae bacterium]